MNVQTNEQIQLLAKSGLTEVESKIYILLLGKGELNGNQIAEDLLVERSLIYRALKNMVKKDLLGSSNESYNCKYSIEDTNHLLVLPDKNLKAAKASFDAVKEFINQVPAISLDGILKSKVRVFRGEDSITKVYQERNISGDKLIREISTDTIFPGIENKWWDAQIEIRKNNKSYLHQLVDVADSSTNYHRTNKKQFKEVRQVPDDFNIEAGINIYKDKIAFHNSSITNPIALVIEDEAMVKLMKNLFDFIWNRSKVI